MRIRTAVLAVCTGAALLSGCSTLGALAPTVPGLDDLISVTTTLGSAVTPIGREEEIEIGRSIAASVAGKYGIVRNEQITRYVCLVGETVAAKSKRTDISYYFAILDTDIINAFSCPGGYVFITRGALSIIESEAELAAVLAHEISHVANKDIINEIEKQQFLFAGNEVAGTLLHTDPAVFNAATAFGTDLLFKGFSRSDELAADKQALSTAADAGYDPAGLLTFLERLKAGSSVSGGGVKLLLATHPQIDDRIENIQEMLSEMPDPERAGERLEGRYIEHVRPRTGFGQP